MIKLLAVDDEPVIFDILKKTFYPIGFTVLIQRRILGGIKVIDLSSMS